MPVSRSILACEAKVTLRHMAMSQSAMTADSSVSTAKAVTVPWEVRVWWRASDGVTCPEFTIFGAMDENAALDEAVSVMDGCRHHRALIAAVRAEIRRTGSAGSWRTIGVGHMKSYI